MAEIQSPEMENEKLQTVNTSFPVRDLAKSGLGNLVVIQHRNTGPVDLEAPGP
jgi:hypothetical protein